MKKTLTSLLAAAAIAGTLAGTATDASARGGFFPGLAAGIFTGIVAGAIITHSMRPGYAAYPYYSEPVAGPGCYWSRQPIYDRHGRVVGWTGEVVQVCP